MLIFLFVLLPNLEFWKRFDPLRRIDFKPLKKWPDVKELLDLAFGRVPQFQYSAQIALALALIFTYFALKADPVSLPFMHVLCLAMFAYLGHLFSDELFDTFWNSIISLFSFLVILLNHEWVLSLFLLISL